MHYKGILKWFLQAQDFTLFFIIFYNSSNFLFPFYNSLYIFKKQEYSNASGYVFPYPCGNEIIGMGLYMGTDALEKTQG